MVVGGRVLGRTAAAVFAVAAVLLSASATAYGAQQLGGVTQLSGKAGCFTYDGASDAGPGTCAKARGLAEGESAEVSPDGRNVYAGSYRNSGAGLGAGYAIFKRNTSSGALTQLAGKAGCLTTDGASNAGAGTCAAPRGLLTASGDGHDIAFTTNGKWVYIATDDFPASIMIFRRNTSTGALTQLSSTAGCITTDGSSQAGAGTCKQDPHLLDASGLTFSSDERFLYVTGTGGSRQIEVYKHNASTGALTDIECISQAPVPSGCQAGRVVGDTQEIALAPNGKHAYAGQYNYGISVFDRNPSTGLLAQKAGKPGCITDNGLDDQGSATCTTARVARATFPLLISPNGKWLYNLDGHIGFSTFRINGDGTLAQLAGTSGCTTGNGKDNTGASTCAVGRAISEPYGGAISPDGRTLYVSDDDTTTSGGLGVFQLSKSTGVATQLAANAGCITADGSTGAGGAPGTCANGRALGYGYGMSLSPDGRSIYQATDASSNAGLAIYRRKAAPPVLSGLHASGHAGSLKIRFKLSVPALVICTFSRSGHHLPGRLVESGKAGANLFRFGGKLGGHTLGAGTYRITATPVGGKPKKAPFTLAR
jgi:DNA-binding beta-propeller fold protein YncE